MQMLSQLSYRPRARAKSSSDSVATRSGTRMSAPMSVRLFSRPTFEWLAPGLAVIALFLFAIAPNADGPILVFGWSVALIVFRCCAGLMRTRAGRVAIDAAMGGLCVLAAFEGGWFLLPCVVAYTLIDLRRTSDISAI